VRRRAFFVEIRGFADVMGAPQETQRGGKSDKVIKLVWRLWKLELAGSEVRENVKGY
jgi:hypothetical protein